MSELSIFKNNALANSDLFKSLQGLNDNLAGGGAGVLIVVSASKGVNSARS
jgi:hypothetical protein